MTTQVIKSAERVLAILEHFRRTRGPASVSELARALDLPQSSTSMLLKSLVALGYLDYTASRRTFLPTFRVALLGEWMLADELGAGHLTDKLNVLQKATKETVILGRQNGARVQYLHVLQQNQGVQLGVKSGTLRPMTLAAVGQALLMIKPDEEVRGIIRRNNADAVEPEQRVPERELLEEIRRFRAQGYAQSQAIIDRSASVIAMVLPHEVGTEPLAVGVGGPLERINQNRDHIVEALRACVGQGDDVAARSAAHRPELALASAHR